MTCADAIIRAVMDAGVDTVFTVTGGLSMHLNEAARKSGIRSVFQHHEQCCAIAADAYARETGKFGFVIATGGPGGLNLVTGVAGAWQDFSPVLFVVGDCKFREHDQRMRQHGTLSCHVVPIVKPITKKAMEMTGAKHASEITRMMIGLATSRRPGPVLMEVPLDVQGAEA